MTKAEAIEALVALPSTNAAAREAGAEDYSNFRRTLLMRFGIQSTRATGVLVITDRNARVEVVVAKAAH